MVLDKCDWDQLHQKFFGKLEIIKSQYRPNKSSLGVVQ